MIDASEVLLRDATAGDAAVIGRHRAAMFRDMGLVPDTAAEQALAEATARYAAPAIARGEYLGWLAVLATDPESVVGGAGVQLRPIVPRPGTGGFVLTAPQALVLNVYTEPGWRRRGVGARLMAAVLSWAERAGVSGIALHASDAGRPLYERLGFLPTNEMSFHGAPVSPPHASRTQ